MPGRVDSEAREPIPQRSVSTTLQLPQVFAHVARTPGVIARECRDCVPVRIMRQHEDHRVMSGTAPQCCRARIQYSAEVIAVFPVASLARRIAVMPDRIVPLERVILARVAVKSRHVIIVGKARSALRPHVPARLEQEYPFALFGQSCRKRAPAGTGADDHIIPSQRPAAHGCQVRLERLEELDQGALVVIAQHGLRAERALICRQVGLVVELGRTEVVPAIDDVIRALAEV